MNNKSNPLSFFGLENWKIFQQEQCFDFTNINLLVGTNNSGKTSLIEAIKMVQAIFKEIDLRNNKKLKLGRSTHPLNSICEIELPEDMEHISSFANLINEKSNNNEFSFLFKVEDLIFPEQALFVKFTYLADFTQSLKAHLKAIIIKTIHDEEIVKILPEEVNQFFDRNSAIYKFKILHNYNLLKKYFVRAGLIKSMIDKYSQLTTNSTSEEDVDTIIKIDKNNRKNDLEVQQIVDQLDIEFGIKSDDFMSWENRLKDFNFPENLFFDYIYFTKSDSIYDHIYEREDIANKVKVQLGERQFDFPDIFPTLALTFEEVVFDYLWSNNISIRDFLSQHEGANFFSEVRPDIDSHNGIDIVMIAKESEFFDAIVSKLIEEKKISDIETVKMFFDLNIVIKPDNKKLETWTSNIENLVINNLPDLSNYFFLNYKDKKLNNFYKFRNNELGLDERIFKELSKKDTFAIEILEFIERYLQVFNIGNRLIITHINKINAVTFEVERNNKLCNISTLGYGSSNILMVLLSVLSIASKSHYMLCQDYESLFNDNNRVFDNKDFYSKTVLFLEEPEANLHPALQSKLADLLVEANQKFNIQFVVETHSEYLIRKLQFLTGKGDLTTGATHIYYFYHPANIPKGETQVKNINIQSNGSLTDNFGKGFFDEADNIALELFLINKNQNN
jgi:hypothetical protein